MSELTAYNSERIYWAVEQVEQEAGDLDTLHLDDNLFYLKSEADKVIAEKDTEIQRLRRALWLARAYRGRDNSILLTSKFMRNVWDNVERKCLAKAEEYKR